MGYGSLGTCAFAPVGRGVIVDERESSSKMDMGAAAPRKLEPPTGGSFSEKDKPVTE
jgi:hypothetical protein